MQGEGGKGKCTDGWEVVADRRGVVGESKLTPVRARAVAGLVC